MSRIETSNTWEEGLVMDLNPLSTPSNVLTDCVNGTFITYNGNEFSLQNDQGNYKLEYCKLTPNYIPVGIKEYGDILYIVSQNPLDNSVEIGSYPSPLMITKPDEKYNDNDFESIIDSQILDKGLTEGNYTELMENASSIIFNGEDYKLNPGDEYCLQTEGIRPPYKYETIEYHILDEDSNVHVVTDKIKLDENGDPKDFQHVAWTVPGWLSVKARLAELSVAGINVRSFYVPKNNGSSKAAHFAFNLRLNVNDKHLMNTLNSDKSILQKWCENIEHLDDVRFRVFIEKENSDAFESIYDSDFVEFGISDKTSSAVPNNFFLNEHDWTEWYGESRTLWKNISGKIENLELDDKVRVRMIPVLYEPQYGYKIVYDNLEQSLLFDLAAIEDDEWDLGNELYQFYTSTDEKDQYIYTNITGPMISSFPVNLYYQIYDIHGKALFDNMQIFSDYSGIGENVLQIPFAGKFKKENIYIIQFKFAPSENEIGNFSIITRFLISSEVFNDFTDIMMYDRDIKFDEWIKRYWAHNKTEFELNYKDIDIENITGYVNETIYENDLEGNVPTESDIKYNAGSTYNTFFPDENSGLSDSIKYRKGFTYNLEYNTKINNNPLQGDLWKDFGPTNNLKMMDYSNNKKVTFKQYESTSEDPTYKTISISAYLELLCKYQKMGLPFDFADTGFWYFNDKLVNLKPNGKSFFTESDGKLTDYVYEADIKFYGSKSKDDKRVINVYGKLLKSNTSINGYAFSKEVQSGAGEKQAFLLSEKIYKALVDKKLPCLLVKINYMLEGPSYNYHLCQTIAGGPDAGDIYEDFTFHKESETSFTRYYIAFRELTKSTSVLLPLGLDSGKSYFNNICKTLSVSLKEAVGFVPTDRYVLNLESIIQYDPRLTIYNVGQFSQLEYNSIKLKTRTDRINLINSLKSVLKSDVLYKTIILDTKDVIDKAMCDESFVVFDKVLAAVSFESEKFPYVSKNNMVGISELRSHLLKISSGAETDFDKWSNSPQLNEGGVVEGLYCDKITKTEDSLLQEMSNGYLKHNDTANICLAAKTFDRDDGITTIVLKHKWKKKNDEDVLENYFYDKAMWMTYHNPSNTGAEADNYVLLGGCLNSDPDIRLDTYWTKLI